LQLVLLEDVPHLGKQGALVEVRPGYARNYLLPNSLAVVPTQHNLMLLERYKIKVMKAREARIADLKILASQINLVTLTMEVNAHEVPPHEEGGEPEWHLYGSVAAHDVSRALKGKNLKVEPEMVKLESPIRVCALYEIPINLGYDIEAKVKVAVIPQMAKK
jgi:large subunit ribosomal protein L9